MWESKEKLKGGAVVLADDKFAYLGAMSAGVMIFDVADPRSPKTAGHYGKPKNKLVVWGMSISKDQVYLTYIKAFIPFRGTWSGTKAVTR